MKAIILTFAPVNESEKKCLIETSIYKIALNQHAENLKPNIRICTDYGVFAGLLKKFKQKIVSTREYVPHERQIYAGQISFKGSTLVACIEYLIYKKYDNILIVGDNKVHTQVFQERVKAEINEILRLNHDTKIYQYSNGNFNLPVVSIENFIKERNF